MNNNDKYIKEILETMDGNNIDTVKSILDIHNIRDSEVYDLFLNKSLSLYNQNEITPIDLWRSLKYRREYPIDSIYKLSTDEEIYSEITFYLLIDKLLANFPYKLTSGNNDIMKYSIYIKDEFEKDPIKRLKLSLMTRSGFSFSSYFMRIIFATENSRFNYSSISYDSANELFVAMKLLGFSDYRCKTMFNMCLELFNKDSNDLIEYRIVRRLLVTSYFYKELIPEEKILFNTIIEYISQKKYNRRYGKAKMQDEFFNSDIISTHIFNEMIDYIEGNLVDKIEHPKFIANLVEIGINLL